MSTVLNSIIRHKARKLAFAHIKRALGDIQSGGHFAFEACQREISRNYWQRKSVNLVFDMAYEGPWHELGSDDAEKGRRRFDLPAYLKGWRSRILALAFDGWVNPRIIQQYGWTDEVIGQQYLNAKRELDELDWTVASIKPKPLDELS